MHNQTVTRRRAGQSRLSLANVRRRIRNAGAGGIVALILLPLLGVVLAQAVPLQYCRMKPDLQVRWLGFMLPAGIR